MELSLYECCQGMKTQSQTLEAISNNMANAQTSGFKADIPFFTLVKNAIAGGAETQASTIVPDSATDFQQGLLKNSANPLDLALEGKGFFCVKTPTGLAYTRNGNFQIDGQGYLVTGEGYRVQGVETPTKTRDIRLDRGNNQIDQMGNVLSDGASVGVLKIADFNDYSKLEKLGGSLFRPFGGGVKEIPAESWVVRQGFIENSNFSPTSAMVEIILVIRRFEMLNKAMNVVMNEVEKKSIDQVGRSKS